MEWWSAHSRMLLFLLQIFILSFTSGLLVPKLVRLAIWEGQISGRKNAHISVNIRTFWNLKLYNDQDALDLFINVIKRMIK